MLPKIEQPLFKMIVPSTKKDIMVRPMLVKEEKILLMAKEGNDYGEKLLSIKQVVTDCCQGELNKDLTVFDIEYLLLKIRSLSVDNIVKITYVDEDDEKEREFDIDLNKVEVNFEGEKDKNIPMGEKSGISLRYPTSSLYQQVKDVETSEDFMDELVVNSLATYYDGDTVYDLTKETPDNLKKFVDENISSAIYYKIRDFLGSIPTLKHEVKYENDEGKEKTITLTSLNDFFTF